MKVNKTVFVTSAVKPAHYPEPDHPEVAFAGRSNVGKSSLINCLVKRRKLVRTSSRPGRTQLLNFFLINDCLSLVDLPGYGYAKAPVQVRAKWGPMVRTYLQSRPNLKGVVLLLDLRRQPGRQDLDFLAWLSAEQIPCLLAATKADKVKPGRRPRAVADLVQALPPASSGLILFSALTGQGREELWAAISALTGV
ncbi:MAG: YihA family ribosome biogenesis GTP-binding protein [Deltaproteobacteria bacterium]|nr:YihA family ribosome biogenesis GTP-binding protein [Deltaproteobacteria bacterium]